MEAAGGAQRENASVRRHRDEAAGRRRCARMHNPTRAPGGRHEGAGAGRSTTRTTPRSSWGSIALVREVPAPRRPPAAGVGRSSGERKSSSKDARYGRERLRGLAQTGGTASAAWRWSCGGPATGLGRSPVVAPEGSPLPVDGSPRRLGCLARTAAPCRGRRLARAQIKMARALRPARGAGPTNGPETRPADPTSGRGDRRRHHRRRRRATREAWPRSPSACAPRTRCRSGR